MSEADQIAAKKLQSFIDRIENLEEERSNIAADLREIYAQARGDGFDAKTMRQVIKLRKLDAAERREQEQILDLYKSALGMD